MEPLLRKERNRGMTKIGKLAVLVRTYLTHRYWRRSRSRSRLVAFQSRRLRRHVGWVTLHSPFYRALQGRPLSEFPIVDKSVFMSSFDELNTRGIRKADAQTVALKAEATRDFRPKLDDITVGLSSGTSGHRSIFLVSEKEEVMWTAFVLAELVSGWFFSRMKVALFLRVDSNLYESLKIARVELRFFDLARPVEDLRSDLAKYNPNVIVSTPSMLKVLARYRRENRLDVTPRRIYSTAEVLDPLDQKFIEQSFGQTVFQVYHCTEGFLGVSCRYGTIHLNEDIIHVEKQFVDPARRKFIPIITDLARETQPIVRYRLNDILTLLKSPCPCGSVFTGLEFIEGREDDMFYFRTREGELRGVFPDVIRGMVMTHEEDIRDYRVVQKSFEEIEFFLQCDGDAASLQQHLERKLSEYCGELGVVRPAIRFCSFVEHPLTKKLRRVERRFSLDAPAHAADVVRN
jgi:putative adenylate-forming enzyme